MSWHRISLRQEPYLVYHPVGSPKNAFRAISQLMGCFPKELLLKYP